MTLTAFAFNTANLFSVIRQNHLTSRGLFAGQDSRGFVFVIADATFYDLEIFRRSFNHLTFTDHAVAQTASGNIRAVTNGQIFNLDWDKDYNTAMWIGEIIDNGTVAPGLSDPNSAVKWFFGKAHGRTAKAYLVGKGNPSAVNPSLENAASSLLPIVITSCPYSSNQGHPVIQNGVTTQCHSPTVQTLMSSRDAAGKTIYGIHRATNLLFFLVQGQSLALGGVDLQVLIGEIQSQGVEDALLGDSHGSAYLIVDGVIEASVTGGQLRDRAIPVGLQLQLYALTVASGTTTFNIINDPTLATKVGSLPAALTNVGVTLEWTASGLKMTITSLGGGLTSSDLLMGLQPLILGLKSPIANDLVQGATFELSNGNTAIKLDCTLAVANPADPGKLTGTFEVNQDLGDSTLIVCSGNIEWFLA